MKVKELQKTVNIAWSPGQQHPIYLAAGTAAQQLDSGATSTLEVFSTNFSDPSYDLALKASLPSQYRFQKLIWSATGVDATHPNGLIVGGCEGGHIMIYSAAKMLAHEEGLIARQDKHTGAVTGLDVNPFQSNLLASSASESEIFIWDLNNTSTHMNPGTKTQPFEDVQNVAWNRQVQHILASVFSSRCVIWDLRKSEQIIKLSDTQSRVRWHAIQWHPEVATQVWLASEDDQAPVVQLWDLRYATAPAKTMQIHQRGVLGMSWCPRDVDLMVSCGKDNHIYCWNPNTEIAEGEILSEVATTSSWYSDVQWCPRNPALIASSSLDGNVSIYSLFGGTQQQVQTSNKIADSFPGMANFAQAPLPQQSTQIVYHDLKHAPKWIKRPSGVSFGFGGKLVEFNSKSKTVIISQVITEPALVERANQLERTLNEANFAEYCRQRADQMPDQGGRYLWYFIKANFEPNPKEEMLNLLGYNKDDVDSKFANYSKSDVLTATEMEQVTNRLSYLTHQGDNNAVFDGLAEVQKRNSDEQSEQPPSLFKIPSGGHGDSLITEALLTGNSEAAAELCLSTNRTAEALIIASTAGIEFLTKIQNRYLQQQQTELSHVIAALVTRNWLDFVTRCTLDSWKEALVAALRHSERKVVDICEKLGDRLLNEAAPNIENTQNAIICYICAGSIDKLVTAWYQAKQLEQHNSRYQLNTLELQELAEVVMLMNKSLEQQGIAMDLRDCFGQFIREYGGLLASQGALTAALAYMFALGPIENAELEAMRERIFNTVNAKTTAASTANLFPQQQQDKQQQQPQPNIYARPQRNSISQTQPLNYVPAAVPAAVQPTPLHSVQNQFQPNSWNTAPSIPQAPLPVQSPIQQQASVPPLNDIVPQPPRPPSTSSSQGAASITGGSGLHSRSKYVLDPSVAPTVGSVGAYGAVYNQTPAMSPNLYNTAAFNTNPMGGTGGGIAPLMPQAGVPNYNASNAYVGANNYYQGMPGGVEQHNTAMQPPPVAQVARNPTPPPGWNDPPALKASKPPKTSDAGPAAVPITHPIFGSDPNQNQNGYPDSNMPYQQASGLPPPPPMGVQGPKQSSGGYQASTHPSTIPNNNNIIPTQSSFMPQPMAIPQNMVSQQKQPQHQQQQSAQWSNQSSNIGYTEHAAPVQHQPEPVKEKPPLPEEFVYLQTVLEELRNQCLATATDPRMKRKFIDVAKRLENLYDCLRDGRLTPATISALNQMVQSLQVGDYGSALQMQTQIAFGSDFSQCAGFMPGLKVLVQSAAELHIYLR